MEIVPIEVFGMHIDVPFPSPLGFAQANIEEFGAALCEADTGLTLRSDQIRLKRWDDLFGYELSAHFFGENGTLIRTSDRIKLGIRNARTAADLKIMCDAFARLYEIADCDSDSLTAFSAHAHGKFASAEERESYLQRFSYSPMVNKPAALGYVNVLGWEKDIRVLIEASNVVPDAVFVMWETLWTNDQDWDTFLPTLQSLLDNSANLFDLGFEPLRERV
ncbi:MAG TPA: hypothetical protein VGO90_13565 [Chthoniobacteraceae bacterium]|jgi:hypothetical protein|nr:hypothetical protein [Chthoniobacteraceae bacterium]